MFELKDAKLRKIRYYCYILVGVVVLLGVVLGLQGPPELALTTIGEFLVLAFLLGGGPALFITIYIDYWERAVQLHSQGQDQPKE